MKKFPILAISVLLLVFLAFPGFSIGRQQGAQSSDLSEIGFRATGYPVVTRPYSFRAAVNKGPMHGPYAQMEAILNMQNKTGITVVWDEIPQANFNERKNLILASNDLPDVFMSNFNDSDILRYGQAGTLIPMENLINQYAPNIKDLFEKRPDVRRLVTSPSGHINILPRIQELAHRVNPDNMFINKTWLDKLGLQVPNTTEEFANVLRAFRDRDPNGNGRRDEIPLSFVGNNLGSQFDIASLFAGFGMYDNNLHLMVRNGRVYFTANTPEFRNALVYFNQLYSEGLIDPEAFTHNTAQYTAKGTGPEPLLGVFIAWFDENNVGAQRAKNDYIALPPLLGVDGNRHWNTDAAALLSRDNFSITSAMRHPEVAIRWADLCYEWSTSLELCYGPWDICLVMDGDRIIQLPPPAGMSQDEFRYAHCPAATTPFAVYEADHLRMNLAENHIRKFARLDMYRQYFPAPDEIYPRVFFLQEEEDELVIIRTDIQNYVTQMRAQFITGAESLNGWNTYVQRLNQMGLSRYLEIYQAALDRYNRG
jgi:putative aldouronate transport system substrate-binding protein